MENVSWRSQGESGGWKSADDIRPSFRLRANNLTSALKAITWTRATVATVTDYQGNIVEIPSGGVALQGLRVARNLMPNSEALGSHTLVNSTVSSNAVANPLSGTVTADKLILDSTSSVMHGVSGSAAVAALVGEYYIFSGYFKAAELRYVWLNIYRDTTASNCASAQFDLNTGTFLNMYAGIDYGIQDVGNGWYRCWTVSSAITVAQNLSPAVYTSTSQYTNSVDGDGTSGIYVYGLQLQRARPGQYTPDEYVPTNTLVAPYYQGFGADGLRYLNTDENGARILGDSGYKRRNNLFSYSCSFNQSVWSKTRSSIIADQTTAPDGTLTADKFVENTTANNTHYFRRANVTVENGRTYIFSIYVKANGRDWLMVQLDAGYVYLNLATQEVGNTGGLTSYNLESIGDGWYRVSVVGVVSSSSISVYFHACTSGTNVVYTGNGSSGFYIWGALLELAENGQTTPGTPITTDYYAKTVMEKSEAVTPVVPAFAIRPQVVNRIPYSTPATGWSTLGACTGTAAYDAQVGPYSQVRGMGAAAVDALYLLASGYSVSARIETAFMLRAVSTSGSVYVGTGQGPSYGVWHIDLSLVSTTRFERIDRFHPAVTIVTEMTSSPAATAGVYLCTQSGSANNVDVALVTQVDGERVHRLVYSAGSVTTINADVPQFAGIPTFVTSNAGCAVIKFKALAETAYNGNAYMASPGLFYKQVSDDTLVQWDGTTSSNFGEQTERAATKIATSWQAGVGRYGYRDGTSKFVATAYDGAWESATLTLNGPQDLYELTLFQTAMPTSYLSSITS